MGCHVRFTESNPHPNNGNARSQREIESRIEREREKASIEKENIMWW